MFAIERRQAAGYVAGNAVAGAPEQAPDRLPERLALDVPQRDVDGADGVISEPGLAPMTELAIQRVPDPADLASIHADDHRRDHRIDERAHSAAGDQTSDAVTDQARLRFDLGEKELSENSLVDSRRLQWNGRSKHARGDATNFHYSPQDDTTTETALR